MKSRSKIGSIFFGLFAVVVIGLSAAYLVYNDLSLEASDAKNTNSKPTLTQLWNNQAQLTFYKRYTQQTTNWNAGFEAGLEIFEHEGIWYMLQRDVIWNATPHRLRTVMRRSFDQGNTWSEPFTIVELKENTPYEYAFTDGDIFFDQETNTWHILAQCLTKENVWNGCHATRNNSDPFGTFEMNPANPVVVNKEIWNKICKDSSSDCQRDLVAGNRVGDEGTFDIVEKKDGWFYVTFHGYDGLKGYRGVARTKNFKNWDASNGSEKFKDSIFDYKDITSWRESWANNKPIGVGHARTLKEGNFYYTLIEGADMNLVCTPNQNWNIGFYRSKNLYNTKWAAYPSGNPLIYSSKSLETQPPYEGSTYPCSVGYVGMFKDSSSLETFIYFSRITLNAQDSGIYIYKIEPRLNIIENGDLSRCDGKNWKRINGKNQTTNLAIYRHPFDSSDYNCYLAANCGGTSCEAGIQNVFTDVKLNKNQQKKDTNYSFSAKMRVRSGDNIGANIGIFQIDKNDKVIGEPISIETRSLNTDYQTIQSDFVLREGATKIRIGFYILNTNAGDYMIDEVSLIPVQ